ncbi:amidase family protein [Sphingomonas jatrophae]|uniref:amidase family protein n=1 Tax=Sphingomonas jatrophae TaxID=1166337 RepID=UPI000AEBCE20|nr:amidase family protein [Sphingomonas jatrophae]
MADVAALFEVMSGSPAPLSPTALRGVRVAVLRPAMAADLAERFDAACKALQAAGAVLVPVERPKTETLGEQEYLVLKTEFKAAVAAYLAKAAPAVTARDLDALIAFNRAHAGEELRWFGQELFEEAAQTKGLDDPAYRAARIMSRRTAAAAIDAMRFAAKAQFIVSPSGGPAWLSDPVNGDQSNGPSASRLPAVSGYPHLTVPMGLVRGLPVGLSFFGPSGRSGEARLLAAGYAFEQAAKARVAPRYLRTIAAE